MTLINVFFFLIRSTDSYHEAREHHRERNARFFFVLRLRLEPDDVAQSQMVIKLAIIQFFFTK